MRKRQLAIGGALVTLVLALSACSGSGGSGDDFESVVREARDQAQLRIDEAQEAVNAGSERSSLEAFLMGPLADNLTAISDALTEYADTVESQDAPDEYADDVERHVPAMREFEGLLEQLLDAAREGDDAVVAAVQEEQRKLATTLAAGLSAEYAEFAFVEPFEASFTSLFAGASDEELAYFNGVREAQNEFSRRNADFGRALGRQYASSEELLRALYAAGAGEAFAAVQERALALDPPEQFAPDHERWLELLEEQVRLDRIIGEAAKNSDVVAFLANNIRLGLTVFPDVAEVDPTFGAVFAGPPEEGPTGLAAELDANAPVAETEYGQNLFSALKRLAATDPSAAIFGLFELPAPDEARLAAIGETKDELLAVAEDRQDSIAALDAPSDYAGDHEKITGYFDDFAAYLDSVVTAAESGNASAVQAATEDLNGTYCEAAASLSEDIAPAAEVFFDPDASFCRG